MTRTVHGPLALTLALLAGCGGGGHGGGNDAFPGPHDADAAYLLTDEDATGLERLIDPYKNPAGRIADTIGQNTQRTGDSGARTYLRFVEAALRDAMALPPFAGGRTFDVVLMLSRFPNAMADAWQHVVITTPAIDLASDAQMLAILCHEMAHSTLNHLYDRAGRQAETPRSAREKAENAVARYIRKTYDTQSRTYRHDRAAYDTARDAVDAARDPGVTAFAMRQESEADVAGGMICAELGLEPATFREGLEAFFAAARAKAPDYLPDGKRASELADGAVVRGISLFDLTTYLFSVQDHPKDDERTQQLDRLDEHLQRHYHADVAVARRWLDGYDAARAGVTAGLSR